MTASVKTRRRNVSWTTAGTRSVAAKARAHPVRRLSLMAVSDPLAEQPAGGHEQDRVEDGEDGQQGVAGVQVDEEKRLDDPEEERRRRDARKIPHAGEYDDEKSEDREVGPHLRGQRQDHPDEDPGHRAGADIDGI